MGLRVAWDRFPPKSPPAPLRSAMPETRAFLARFRGRAGKSDERPVLPSSIEIMHLPLSPIAFCMVGEGQGGVQNPRADSPRSFPRLIRIAPQVGAGKALVEFSTAVASR